MFHLTNGCLLILMIFNSLTSAQVSTQHQREYLATKQNRNLYSGGNLRSQYRFVQSAGLEVGQEDVGTITARQGPNVCGAVCCRGWKLSKQGYCILPICNPLCQNQGLCWWPNKCKCKYAYQGKTCAFKRYGTGVATMRALRKRKNGQNERLVSIYTLPRALTPLESRRARTCLTVVCSNGGGCLRGRCICPRSFTGPRCERPVSKTIATTSFNSSRSMHFRTFPRSVCRYLCKYGSCVPTQILGRSTCSCFSNYHGIFCDVKSISSIQRSKTQRYSALKTKGQVGNCYRKYRRKVCSLALVGKRTAKSCCSGYGIAWGPKCIPCRRIRGLKPRKKFPRTSNCPRGFVRIQTACRDINECNISPTKCINGRCVNVRGAFWCLCDAGFHPSRTRKTCLPNIARETASGTCYTSLDSNGNCPRTGAMRGKRSDCCCSVGVAWGNNCKLCPTHGSDEKRRMCPFGTLHPETIPRDSNQRDDIDISIYSTQAAAMQNTTGSFTHLYNPSTAPERDLQESIVGNGKPHDNNTDVFDAYRNRGTVEKAGSVDLMQSSVRVNDTTAINFQTTPDPKEFSTQEELAFSFPTLQPSTQTTSFSGTVSAFKTSSDGKCIPSFCKNGGTCQPALKEKSISCICHPGYYGAKCEQEIPKTPPSAPAATSFSRLISTPLSKTKLTSSKRKQSCFTKQKRRRMCSGFSIKTTYKKCCCSIGTAWGSRCTMCPRRGSNRYIALCLKRGPESALNPTKQTQREKVQCGNLKCTHGTCVRRKMKIACMCNKGYKLNARTRKCEDINECIARRSLRSVCIGGRCVNSNGSFRCICLNDWKPLPTRPNVCVRRPAIIDAITS